MASDPPTKKTKLDESSGTNPAPSDDKATSDDSNPYASDKAVSESNPAASDNTSLDSKIDKPSGSNPTTSDDKAANIKKQYDLYFVFRPAFMLKNAVEALSDTNFNPGQKAVIQAGENGCEITVCNPNDELTDGQVFGLLRLNATALGSYECRNPFRMMFSLNGVAQFLRDGVSVNELLVTIFVEEGSELLSFQLTRSPDAGSTLGRPFNIELSDVSPEQEEFPDVRYGLEAVVPITTFKSTVLDVMLLEGNSPTEEVFSSITGPGTVVTTHLNDDQVKRRMQCEEDLDNVWLNWVHWNSLERASIMADECLVYLVTSPPKRVMVRLIVVDHMEIVFLNQFDFLSNAVNTLPCLGHFRSLFSDSEEPEHVADTPRYISCRQSTF